MEHKEGLLKWNINRQTNAEVRNETMSCARYGNYQRLQRARVSRVNFTIIRAFQNSELAEGDAHGCCPLSPFPQSGLCTGAACLRCMIRLSACLLGGVGVVVLVAVMVVLMMELIVMVVVVVVVALTRQQCACNSFTAAKLIPFYFQVACPQKNGRGLKDEIARACCPPGARASSHSHAGYY